MMPALLSFPASPCRQLGVGALRREFPEAFPGSPQITDGSFESGAGEAAAGHDASLADGSPVVTANAAGGFA